MRQRRGELSVPIRFFCPECEEPQQVSDALAGLDWRCASCHVRVAVPHASDPKVPLATPQTAPAKVSGSPASSGTRANQVFGWVSLLVGVAIAVYWIYQ